MHYHHHHDTPCDDRHEWPDWVLTILASLSHLEDQHMTQQDQLNTDVQAISAALDSLAGEITDLKGQLAAQVPDSVDLSALDAIAAKAQSLIPSAPADNTPPSSPSNTPGDPTVDTSTATTDPVEDPNADGTVPGTNPTPTV